MLTKISDESMVDHSGNIIINNKKSKYTLSMVANDCP